MLLMNAVAFAPVLDNFLGISAWMKWCYSQLAELCFGKESLVAPLGYNRVIL